MSRTFNILALILAAGASAAMAADNLTDINIYPTTGSERSAILTATEVSPGVLTPHVIVTGGPRRTPTIATVTGNGTVQAGARSLTFIFSTTFAGTVLGATFAGADGKVTIEAPAGDTLGAASYTITAGNIRIVEVR